MPAIVAEVTRGGVVESVHHGVVVAVDTAGQILAFTGDPDQFAYFRSSAKPFQAIPLVESGAADAFGFTPAELALCCASHSGSPAHQTQVAAMLAKIGLDPAALRCGSPVPYDRTEGARVRSGLVPSSPLQCDCSGKHTGMLATCLHMGWPTDSYLDPNHPLQRQILGIIAEVLRVPETEIHLGTDGCSLPTFGGPIRAFATAYAALAAPQHVPPGAGREHAAALDRLRTAMMAHPANVAGPNEVSTDLMEAGGGRLAAKSGAEGLLCLALPERGLGVALRILDGSYRAQAVVAAAVLEQLDLLEPAAIAAFLTHQDPAIRNHNGIHVGALRAAFTLNLPAGITA